MNAERKEFLLNLFTTALEGGIGYWSETTAYHWMKPAVDGGPPTCEGDLDGFYATIVSNNEDGWGIETTHELADELHIDAEVITKGLVLFAEQVKSGEVSYPGGGDYFDELVIADRTNGKEGDYDSWGADAVVQLGLFGEVMYA